MLMLPVPIFDILKIELTGSRINLNCNHPQIPNGHENLAYQAAEEFKIKAQISGGIRIDLEKNIPVEAGLGGGSGNAAGILLALNKLASAGLEKWSPTQKIDFWAFENWHRKVSKSGPDPKCFFWGDG